MLVGISQVTGDAAAHTLRSVIADGKVLYVFIVADPANSTTPIMVGDSSISLTAGYPVYPGQSFTLPVRHPAGRTGGVNSQLYDTTEIWFLAATGDKFQGVYDNGIGS